MPLPDYGQKRISELPLNNEITDADSIPYDDSESGNSYRVQFLGLVAKMLQLYVAAKDFSNINENDITSIINKLAQAKSPDDGTGLLLRSHGNETENGLSSLSQQLVSATAHIITDKFAESLTKPEFEQLCRLLAGVINRTSTGTADGLLALRDLSNITEDGYTQLTKVIKTTLAQSGTSLIIPASMIGKCIEVSLSGNLTSITLPTSGLTSGVLNQTLIVIKRNGYSISTDAFTKNGYVVRGTGQPMPSMGSDAKSGTIEFFCEYDDFTSSSSPKWNYGYSKIGY